MAKELSEQQKIFLEVLFHKGIDGDFNKAKVAAGYNSSYATSSLTKGIEDEILQKSKEHLARIAPMAVMALGDVLENPTQLGVRDKLAVVKDVLDRVGLSKTEKVEMVPTSIFYLPKKDGEDA